MRKIIWSGLIISVLSVSTVFLFQNCAHKPAQTDIADLVPIAEGTDNHGLLISAGNSHTCVTNQKGQVYCWGKNRMGLSGGANFPADVLVPQKQAGLEDVVQLAAGNDTNCALTRGGEVYCWGSNAGWGLGVIGALSGPNPVKTLEGVKYIDGDYAHFCAVMNGGTVKCWGNSGPGPNIANSQVPTEIENLKDVEKVNVAFNHACALTKEKKLRCWGANLHKMIDTGNLVEDLASIDAGLSHVCGLRTDGTVICWGQSDFGQSGSGQSEISMPAQIPLPATAKKVVAGANTSCALLVDGTVRCWGNNVLGQFGFNSTTPRFSADPEPAAGITGALDLSMGADHACAVLRNRTVKCWGVNAQGQLGNGSLALHYSASPIEVAGLPRL